MSAGGAGLFAVAVPVAAAVAVVGVAGVAVGGVAGVAVRRVCGARRVGRVAVARRVLVLRLLRPCGRGGRRRLGRRGGRRRRRGARTLGVAVCDVRGDRGPRDVDRVRLPGAGDVADVDLLLTGAFAFAADRARQLRRRRRRRDAARAGGGQLVVAVLLLELELVVVRVVREVVLVTGRGRRRSGGRAQGRLGARRRSGDLGEADAGGRREGERDDHSDEGAPAESAESFLHVESLRFTGVRALRSSVAAGIRNLRSATYRGVDNSPPSDLRLTAGVRPLRGQTPWV